MKIKLLLYFAHVWICEEKGTFGMSPAACQRVTARKEFLLTGNDASTWDAEAVKGSREILVISDRDRRRFECEDAQHEGRYAPYIRGRFHRTTKSTGSVTRFPANHSA